jgi:hypothetical protein
MVVSGPNTRGHGLCPLHTGQLGGCLKVILNLREPVRLVQVEETKAEGCAGWLMKETRSRWARLGAAAAWSRMWFITAGRRIDFYTDETLREWKVRLC